VFTPNLPHWRTKTYLATLKMPLADYQHLVNEVSWF